MNAPEDFPYITTIFCRPERETHLTALEGPPLFDRLRDKGYSPMPLKAQTKQPELKRWPLKAARGEFEWMENRPGIGLLCGYAEPDDSRPDHPWRNLARPGDLLALDLDLNKKPEGRDAPMLSLDEQMKVREVIGATPTVLRLLKTNVLVRARSGAGNFVLAVRNDGSIGNGAWRFARDGKLAIEVEILASGRQFAAFALHPTAGPYIWGDGLSPENVPLPALPALTAADLEALHGEIVEALKPFGLVEEGSSRSAPRPRPGNGAATATGRLTDKLSAVEPSTYSRDEVERLCAALAAVLAGDYDAWSGIGFGLKWLAGRGWEETICREIFDAWARTTARGNYDETGQDRLWNSAASDREDGITVATIFHMARENGWSGECVAPAWAGPILAKIQPAEDAATSAGCEFNPGSAPVAGRLAWPVRGEKGPFNDERNVAAALAHLGVTVYFDAFRLTYHIRGLDGFGADAEVTDDVARELRARFERLGLRLQRNAVFEHILAIGRRDSRHPVRAYFDSLAWDGKPRLDTWLTTYCGAEDTPFTRAAGALTLLAVVRRARRPGTKFDQLLVLEGGQGVNKSKGLRALAIRDEWFTDDFELGGDSKKTIEQTRGKLIVEITELNGLGRREVEKVKGQMSRMFDRSRLSYERATTEVGRQFVPVGTSNLNDYLTDLTGNRRFWPVRVARLDVEALVRGREQLWAEVVAREATGVPLELPPSLWAEAAEEQDRRLQVSPIVEKLTELLDGFEGALPTDEIYKALGLWCEDKVIFYREAARHGRDIRAALTHLGWSQIRTKTDGRRTMAYEKGKTARRLCFDEKKRAFVDQGEPATILPFKR